MLTGPEIERQIERGNIRIDPFDPKRVNPNSYNARLGSRLLIYERGSLSTRKPPKVEHDLEITDAGYLLQAGRGYLGHTMERTYCEGFVPRVEGRSSTGRLFLLIHCTAGLGDDGFDGRWTLEIVPLVEDVWVYPGDEILQIYFQEVIGERRPYKGRYQGQEGPVGSRMAGEPGRDTGWKGLL